MKKLLLAIMLAVECIVAPAKAFTSCEGGTIVTRNKYTDSNAPAGCDATTCPATTKTFCKSNGVMTWWSALTWCDAHGGNLATFREMCPGVIAMPNYVEGVCQALQGTLNVNSWVWSGYPYGTNNALIVVPLNGLVGYNSFSVNGYAFCE